jgi:hypothetical protein
MSSVQRCYGHGGRSILRHPSFGGLRSAAHLSAPALSAASDELRDKARN